jgi:hypothetical protein
VAILDFDEDNVSHTITVRSVDAAGNTSVATDPITFTHDSIAPAAPEITSPADGTHTSSADVSLSGTGAGDILIFDGESQIGTVEDAMGSWSHTATGLSEGSHAFTATARDEALNESGPSDAVNVVVDQTAPAMPTVDYSPQPINASSHNATTVLGTAEPNVGIEIVVTDVNLDTVQGTAAADGDGDYADVLDLTSLADGFLDIEVTATDAASNASSASITVAKDTQVARPSVDFTPEVITQANVDAVEVTGAGEAGSNLDVSFFSVGSGNPVVANTTIGEDGTFALTTDLSDLGDGTILATTVLTDQSQNSVTSDCNQPQPNGCDQVEKDTTGPAVASLSITSPAEGATVSTAAVDVTGTAEANASVTLSEGEVELGSGVADANGDWAITTAELAGDGAHTITATQSDEHGNAGTGSVSRTILLDLNAPSVVETSPGDDPEGNTPVSDVTAVSATYSEELSSGTLSLTDKDGIPVSGSTAVAGDTVTWTSGFGELPDVSSPYTATTTGEDPGGSGSESYSFTFHVDNTAPEAPSITSPEQNATLYSSAVQILGTAEADVTITVREGETEVGSTTANALGNWSLDAEFANGSHTITATATDGAQESDPSVARTFTVDIEAPAAPTIVKPVEGATATNEKVTISGTSEPNAAISVREGGVEIATATGGASGAWSTTAVFADGAHSITATATDGAGQTSDESAARTFTVAHDATPPAAPVILSPEEGSSQGAQVAIAGTAEPSSVISLRENGSTLVTTTSNSAGQWSISRSFSSGDHVITAVANDVNGNLSEPSAPRTFNVDATKPSVTYSTGDGQVFLPGDAVTLAGSASDNNGVSAVIIVIRDLRGIKIQEVEATLATPGEAETTWEVTLAGLTPGRYTAVANAIDSTNLQSPARSISFVTLAIL